MTQEQNLLPNGKPHISFSELRQWKECSYRHKLVYIDGIQDNSTSPNLEYGSSLHHSFEHFLKTGTVDKEALLCELTKVWEERGFDDKKFIDGEVERAKRLGYKYEHEPLQAWTDCAERNLEEIKEFLDSEFPGYRVVSVEEQLYEPVEGSTFFFKGFIDAVIEVPTGKGGMKTVLIDWKTTGPRGWSQDKKRDFLVASQLILYKHFWMQRTGQASKDVGAAFVIVRRTPKGKKNFSRLEISAGPTTRERSLKFVKNMLSSMTKGIALKNRNSCKYCPFLGTQHCT